MNSLDSILKRTEAELSSISFTDEPVSLYDPITYILSLGGKRIRPALTLIGCNIYSENIDAAVKPALGIEVFHNFTLLHDDLMDGADRRRNRKTVHKVWSPNVAILSGDAMLIASYRLIGKTPAPYLSVVLDLFTKTALDICGGQQYDMEFEQRMDVTEQEYIRMIEMKTAVLLACALKIGALIGGASLHDADLLYNYGIDLGLAFQLQDDLLDVYGDPESFGKNIGGDIISNKKTFLLLNALRMVEGEERDRVLGWLCRIDCDPERKIAYFTELYSKLGIKELTEQRIAYFYTEAKHNLSALQIADERLCVLKEISEKLMYRQV
ncbi:MAG: polyprenyl synthetase family protein [Massilibacteroides sp.]|nr:polyprenyl synthetase family protein [Massilibacteroides sp.]MDD3062676.1 polyprenyl synthetase family protein [Massilibacteroides sp.]MDD4114732.1 polyprenyl synthetase family protein [Massilibacteroides sp.]MDD4660169.1 polyprenyl synthetase family protein [Massilibacteroides sp.]